MTLKELREARNALAKELRNIHEKNSGEGKTWAPELQAEWDAKVDQISALDAEIKRYETIMDVEATNIHDELAGKRAERDGISSDEAAHRNQMESSVFNTWLRQGDKGLTAEQHQYLAEKTARAMTDIKNLGTQVPSEGGYLTPDMFGDRLLIALKKFGGMRKVSQIITTSYGSTINWPATDPTSEVGELLSAENVSVTDDTSITFASVNINAHMYSSKAIAVPLQLLADSMIDIEGHLVNRLQMRLGRITNQHYTTGTGVNQPYGISNLCSAGQTGATGQSTAVLFDDLIELEHSIDPAYRELGNCSWMFHDSTLKYLKKLKDGHGMPIWLPDYQKNAPASIMQYPYTINQQMPVMAANAKSVLFGDFSFYMIRDVMQFMLFRMMDSAYIKKATVGFLAFMRTDGNGIWAKSSDGTSTADPIKAYANSAS